MANKEELPSHKKIIEQLNSNNEKTILDTINLLREHGYSTMIPELAKLWNNSKYRTVSNQIFQLIKDLKDQSAAQFLVKALRDPQIRDIRKPLLTASYQSRLNFNEFLEDFVTLVIKEDYYTAFEAFTVIDLSINSIGPKEKETATENLKSALLDNNSEKQQMYYHLIHIIEEKENSDQSQ